MWLYSTGYHTLHGIITHPMMVFIAWGHRLSTIIASENEGLSHVEYGDLLNKAICIIIFKTIALWWDHQSAIMTIIVFWWQITRLLIGWTVANMIITHQWQQQQFNTTRRKTHCDSVLLRFAATNRMCSEILSQCVSSLLLPLATIHLIYDTCRWLHLL